MAETTKNLEVTWHFAAIDDNTNEIIKTRKISFATPSNADAADYTSRFAVFKQNYLTSFSLENASADKVGSLLQAAGWLDDDYEGDGSNVEYKCVNLTAEFVEKTRTEIA